MKLARRGLLRPQHIPQARVIATNPEREPRELLASIRRHCFHEWMQITFTQWDWAAYEARNDVWDLMDALDREAT